MWHMCNLKYQQVCKIVHNPAICTEIFDILIALPYPLYFWINYNSMWYEIRSYIFNLTSAISVQICQILQMIDNLLLQDNNVCQIVRWTRKWLEMSENNDHSNNHLFATATAVVLCVIVWPWNDQMTSCAQRRTVKQMDIHNFSFRIRDEDKR